jgi:hypothetical protein
MNVSAVKNLEMWGDKMNLIFDDGLRKLVDRAARLRLIIRALIVPLVLSQIMPRAVEFVYWQGDFGKVGNVELK